MQIISNHIVEAITLITAIANYKHIKGTRYVYFIPVMAFILFGELGGVYFSKPPNYNVSKNLHIYLVITMVENIFLGYQFYHMIQSRKMKLFTFVGTALLTVAMSLWLFFFVNLGSLITNTLGVAGFFFSCLSCFFLYEKFVINEHTDDKLTLIPDFWFSIGILVFWVGSSIPFMLYYFLKNDQILIWGLPLYRFFPQLFSVILYGCFTAAIILWKKHQKQLS